MGNLRVVAPPESQLAAVAEHRFGTAVRNGHTPLVDKDDFVHDFVAWGREHRESHRCLVVADSSDRVLGFGFVALTSRVPGPLRRKRTSGDIQAVYVDPEHRNSGIGSQLLEALIEVAHQEGVEHLTVHSSQRAVTTYQRAGFTVDRLMMYQAGTAPTR